MYIGPWQEYQLSRLQNGALGRIRKAVLAHAASSSNTASTLSQNSDLHQTATIDTRSYPSYTDITPETIESLIPLLTQYTRRQDIPDSLSQTSKSPSTTSSIKDRISYKRHHLKHGREAGSPHNSQLNSDGAKYPYMQKETTSYTDGRNPQSSRSSFTQHDDVRSIASSISKSSKTRSVLSSAGRSSVSAKTRGLQKNTMRNDIRRELRQHGSYKYATKDVSLQKETDMNRKQRTTRATNKTNQVQSMRTDFKHGSPLRSCSTSYYVPSDEIAQMRNVYLAGIRGQQTSPDHVVMNNQYSSSRVSATNNNQYSSSKVSATNDNQYSSSKVSATNDNQYSSSKVSATNDNQYSSSKVSATNDNQYSSSRASATNDNQYSSSKVSATNDNYYPSTSSPIIHTQYMKANPHQNQASPTESDEDQTTHALIGLLERQMQRQAQMAAQLQAQAAEQEAMQTQITQLLRERAEANRTEASRAEASHVEETNERSSQATVNSSNVLNPTKASNSMISSPVTTATETGFCKSSTIEQPREETKFERRLDVSAALKLFRLDDENNVSNKNTSNSNSARRSFKPEAENPVSACNSTNQFFNIDSTPSTQKNDSPTNVMSTIHDSVEESELDDLLRWTQQLDIS